MEMFTDFDPSILEWDEISNKQGARSAEASISSHLSNGSGKQKQQHQLLSSTNNNININSSSGSSWLWDPLLLPPSMHGDGSVGGKMNDSGQTDTQSSAPSASSPSVYTTRDMKQPVSDGNVGASSILNNNMNNNALLPDSNNTVVTSSSSALNDAAATYFLNQGGQINHPLAMTSMASCPPYGATQKDPQQDTSRNAIAAPSSHPSLTTTNAISHHHQQQQQQSNATSDTQNGTVASHLSELTANFNASNNSGIGTYHVPLPLHYGMTVNGFHPQLNAQVNPVFLMGCSQQQQQQFSGIGSTTPAASSAINNTLFLRQQQQVHNMSAAHAAANNTSMSTNARNARDRNEREQVRAKKITELITELRENMQEGGWKEEMNSKYQTLSQ